MPPYTFDDHSDIESEYDSESENARMFAMKLCTPQKCKYCSKDFYDRCWDHDWVDEISEDFECETIHAHNCTHKFKCAACHNQYLTQENLDQHCCVKNYQCEICRKRCRNVKDVNSGNHELRRSVYGEKKGYYPRIVNCNDFFVRVKSTGFRVILRKSDQWNCSTETKEAKVKAETEYDSKPKELRRKQPDETSEEDDECESEDSEVEKQDPSATKEEIEKKRKRHESEDGRHAKRLRAWLVPSGVVQSGVVQNGVVQNSVAQNLVGAQ